MAVRILHLHSTFALGGKEARAVRLMNAFGDAADHTILSAMPDEFAARDAIDPRVRVAFPTAAPSLQGLPEPRRYHALVRYMAGFELILTYNWGAMDGVMARRMWAPVMRLPPLVHHEDGFNADEAERQKPKRVWFRRLGLGAAAALVVPSHRLEAVARDIWRQPAARVCRIPNGIPLDGPVAAHGSRAEIRLVTAARLNAVKALPALVGQLARLNSVTPARLTIYGDGPERDTILAAAAAHGVADRVRLAGFVAAPGRLMADHDIFCLSSLSEQFPISVVEAMAAGLPIVSTAVGDVPAMVAAANRTSITSDPDAYQRALRDLARDPDRRAALGAANRAVALDRFDEAAMIRRYADLYSRVIGRPAALPAG